jgi:2-aminoadipate transaminase
MTKTLLDHTELLSAVARTLRPNAIRKLSKLLTRADVISFAPGAPSPDTFPIAELAEIAATVISDEGHWALQYGPTRGIAPLIEETIGELAQRGIGTATSSEVVITTGSQQGLDLIARVLLDPGDVALVELPSYVGGLVSLHNTRSELVGVRQDESGIDLEDLNEKVGRLKREGRRIKCFYTIPNFQNPSGVTLSLERRRQLVAAAEEHNFLIIEDDPYFELYFDERGSRLTPLAAIAPNQVVYLSSFSKVLAPGLRMAWLRAPEEIASKVEMIKEGADLSSSLLDQALVLESMRTGLIKRRLPEIRQFYAIRCTAMLEALARHAPAGTRWTSPLGGFFVWLELPDELDATDLLPRAIANGVTYVPGQPFCVDDSGTNAMRLAFSKETPGNIIVGIEKLCSVIAGEQVAE